MAPYYVTDTCQEMKDTLMIILQWWEKHESLSLTHTHTLTHSLTHTHTNISTNTCIQSNLHTHTHTFTHADIYTPTHKHTHQPTHSTCTLIYTTHCRHTYR